MGLLKGPLVHTIFHIAFITSLCYCVIKQKEKQNIIHVTFQNTAAHNLLIFKNVIPFWSSNFHQPFCFTFPVISFRAKYNKQLIFLLIKINSRCKKGMETNFHFLQFKFKINIDQIPYIQHNYFNTLRLQMKYIKSLDFFCLTVIEIIRMFTSFFALWAFCLSGCSFFQTKRQETLCFLLCFN